MAIEAVSFRSIATVRQLQLEYARTQLALLHSLCGYALRHNKGMYVLLMIN